MFATCDWKLLKSSQINITVNMKNRHWELQILWPILTDYGSKNCFYVASNGNLYINISLSPKEDICLYFTSLYRKVLNHPHRMSQGVHNAICRTPQYCFDHISINSALIEFSTRRVGVAYVGNVHIRFWSGLESAWGCNCQFSPLFSPLEAILRCVGHQLSPPLEMESSLHNLTFV